MLAAASVLLIGCPVERRDALEVPVDGGKPCSMPTECNDGSLCTIDTCENGACKNTNDDSANPDDGEVCTTDTCVNGEEQHTPTAGPCGEGGLLTCNAEGKCAGCTMPEQCGAAEPCQTRICNAQMVCEVELAMAGSPLPDPTIGDCMTMACDGMGNAESVIDDLDLPPDETNDCTDNVCTDGTPSHPLSMVGTLCADSTTYCNAAGACVFCTGMVGCEGLEGGICFNETECVSCTDGVLNGNETSTDCGGADCGECNGTACGDMAECASGFCSDGVCCDASCDAACLSCNLPGKGGTCSLIPAGSDDDAPVCTDLMTCNGTAACVADNGDGHFGDACVMNEDCFNNTCALPAMVCKLNIGNPCADNIDCKYNNCMNNVCT